MIGWTARTARRGKVAATAAVLVAGTSLGVVFAAPADAAPGPVASRPSSAVTADALPTAQIGNGVVWAQVVVGNTVYVGGDFTTARPAGAAPGTSQVTRTYLLAYNITTGALTSFAPTLDGQVLSLAASPDGTTLYAGGDFGKVNGYNRVHFAAFTVSTGALKSTVAPIVSSQVRAIAATNSTVYLGGTFTTVKGVTRTRLAAVRATDGALTAWNASADDAVNALVISPDGTRVVVGGRFVNVSGHAVYGLTSLDATTGAVLSFAANTKVRDYGAGSAIESLSTDGTSIYGTGYKYKSGTGNLEGMFSANPSTGALNWIEDCHGDTYGNYVRSGVAYTVGHAHYCATVGGFPQTNPLTHYYTVAFTTNVTGTLGHEIYNGYQDWAGTPSPSQINWYPELKPGTYTPAQQAAWSISGNSQYVVEGGEFPTVNGTPQQGLVRFAVPSIAPNLQGPRLSGPNFVPSLVSEKPNSIRVGFRANWDRDDQSLTYKVYRNGNTTTPVYTTTVNSQFWNRPYLGFTDTNVVAGATYSYRVFVNDPSGNLVKGNSVSYTVPSVATASTYAQDVAAAGAKHYWRLGEGSGTTAYDWAGYEDLSEAAGVTHGAAGAISGDSNGASGLDGTANAYATDQNQITPPNTFSLEAWVKTTSTSGGRIVGFGEASTGTSAVDDRQLYFDPAGHVQFGVYKGLYTGGSSISVASPKTYNDGNWHYVVATLSSAGMTLAVDATTVATNTTVTSGRQGPGYWRIGADTLIGWPGFPTTSSTPTSAGLAGTIDDVALYSTVLSSTDQATHYRDSGRTP